MLFSLWQKIIILLMACIGLHGAAPTGEITTKTIVLLDDPAVTLSLEVSEPVHLGHEGWLKVWVDIRMPVVWESAWIGMDVDRGALPDIRIPSLGAIDAGEIVPVGRYAAAGRWDLYGLALLGAPPQRRSLRVTARPDVTLGGNHENRRTISGDSVYFDLVLTPPPESALPGLTKRLHGLLKKESHGDSEWYYLRGLMEYPPLAATVDRQMEADRIARSRDSSSHYHDVDAYLKRWGGADQVLHDAVAQLLGRSDPTMGLDLMSTRPVLNVPQHVEALKRAAVYFSKKGDTYRLRVALDFVKWHRKYWVEGTRDELMAAVAMAFPRYQEALLKQENGWFDGNLIVSLGATGHPDAIAALRKALKPRSGDAPVHRRLLWSPAYRVAPPMISYRDCLINALAVAHYGSLNAAVAVHREGLPAVPLGSEIPKELLPSGEGEVRLVTPYSVDREPSWRQPSAYEGLITTGSTSGSFDHLTLITGSSTGFLSWGKLPHFDSVFGGDRPQLTSDNPEAVPYDPYHYIITGVAPRVIDAPAQREGWRRYAINVAAWYDALEKALP